MKLWEYNNGTWKHSKQNTLEGYDPEDTCIQRYIGQNTDFLYLFCALGSHDNLAFYVISNNKGNFIGHISGMGINEFLYHPDISNLMDFLKDYSVVFQTAAQTDELVIKEQQFDLFSTNEN